MKLQDFIGCPRFGGRRPPLSCLHYDRFRSCRRRCPSLAKWVESNPDYSEKLKEIADRPASPMLALTARGSGRGVPRADVACPYCNFSARSPRGLKTHLTRSHDKARA